MAGTTNEGADTGGYLLSTTGNRRFWPVQIARFDLETLGRDRQQLWAEAVAMEAAGVTITLDKELWPFATAEQNERRLDGGRAAVSFRGHSTFA